MRDSVLPCSLPDILRIFSCKRSSEEISGGSGQSAVGKDLSDVLAVVSKGFVRQLFEIA
jgi:hypothetical protein